MLACIYKNILMVVGGKLKDGQEVHQQQIMELRKSYDIQKGKYRVLSTIKIGSESDTKTSKSVTN